MQKCMHECVFKCLEEQARSTACALVLRLSHSVLSHVASVTSQHPRGRGLQAAGHQLRSVSHRHSSASLVLNAQCTSTLQVYTYFCAHVYAYFGAHGITHINVLVCIHQLCSIVCRRSPIIATADRGIANFAEQSHRSAWLLCGC